MLPDLSVLWVIAFVLLLIVLLNALLFRPLLKVMFAREHAVRSARDLAARAQADAAAALSEYDARTTAARAEIYREMDETRRTALQARAALLADTRGDIERQTAEAAGHLSQEVHAARARLAAEAPALGEAIVERLLDRKVS